VDVFKLRDTILENYSSYVQSFIKIKDPKVRQSVETGLEEGLLWPDPLIQINPSFEFAGTVDELSNKRLLHPECKKIFRLNKKNPAQEKSLRLYRHQADALKAAKSGNNYVLTTGTGSGKSMTYILPIIDYVLRNESGNGIKAIIIYPMNALANSQKDALEYFINEGYPDRKGKVKFARYTGQDDQERRDEIIADPPDILLTNYVMLELILTRYYERKLIRQAQGLKFLVLDELHTYRGRQGADVALLLRRVQDLLEAHDLQFIGTSATLAGPGTYEEQQAEVAQVATKLFGNEVKAEHVIGETLSLATAAGSMTEPGFKEKLAERVRTEAFKPPADYGRFIHDPLAVWIENTFGITRESVSGRLIRAIPKSITGELGGAKILSDLTGVPESRCTEAIKETLLAGYQCRHPETGFPVFAFRLHQFISRGDTVYSTLELENDRPIHLKGQQYVPKDRSKILLPLVFCRACGQAYYAVRREKDSASERIRFSKREPGDRLADDEDGEPGYLYISTENPWPPSDDAHEKDILDRLPDQWLDYSGTDRTIRRNRREWLPETVTVATTGEEDEAGTEAQYLRSPLRFCLNCGISYDFTQRSDYAKLATLGAGGRSTATTIMTLAGVLFLREEPSLKETARKLLSFTDNRQDASLQAGHFNDMIDIGLIRAALYKAVHDTGDQGIRHDALTRRVFQALDLPFSEYAYDPDVKYAARSDTEQALRDVIGYRIYRDLKRGWRLNSPNLEQCGLLKIEYRSLADLCQAQEDWQGCHPALVSASPDIREKISYALLDYMRRELALHVGYLDQEQQDGLRQKSRQHLRDSWVIDDKEKMEYSRILFPRARRKGEDYGGYAYVSAWGGFGRYLRRSTTFPNLTEKLSRDDSQLVINQLLDRLRMVGIVKVVREARSEDDVPGYQLAAGALIWKAGDGSEPYYDPIRVPTDSAATAEPNQFFFDFYRQAALKAIGVRAREHTAQVPYDKRERREELFRAGTLPVLFCSPTMELGIDIAELNVVNMRNIPPTPANYAQRSGRAGRSGQPALVFSYCSTGSSHDQYFYRQPNLMVAGAVATPRIDLANEDLVRSHVHAIWLTATEQKLGSSLGEILDTDGDIPTLRLRDEVKTKLSSEHGRSQAVTRAKNVLSTIEHELRDSDWYSESWVEEAVKQVMRRFDDACARWRSLFQAARNQVIFQSAIAIDNSRPQNDRRMARRLRHEAEMQLELLQTTDHLMQSDFYSYRYFASEGFLPGYSFPRLPLSAYIPGRKIGRGRDEYIQRPRFLAITEFGPKSFIYHEGARYIINKVMIPVSDVTEETFPTSSIKLCDRCGYLHRITDACGVDLCERCGEELGQAMDDLFRLQNVSTKRRERINCDEEERFRLGYEIRTTVRFESRGDRPACRVADVLVDGNPIARLTYGHSATIWRINLGWTRRGNKDKLGFGLDIERGYWTSDKAIEETLDDEDSISKRCMRVIPFVEDRRNCLLFEPLQTPDLSVMASLQAALKNAIQAQYQLEENELAAERLPRIDDGRLLLFYESAEGGAGVLRRFLDDRFALARMAREALAICHFDYETSQDQAADKCEAACYDCLMNYGNQLDHKILDRKQIQSILAQLGESEVRASSSDISRSDLLQHLRNKTDSALERKWLGFLEDNVYHLPDHGQKRIDTPDQGQIQADFYYSKHATAIFVDGPPHDTDHQQEKDKKQTRSLMEMGIKVIRFHHAANWDTISRKYPSIFGQGKEAGTEGATEERE